MTNSLSTDIERGSDPERPVRRFLRACREWVSRHPRVRWVYRLVVGLIGTAVVLLGLVLVPLPGPGWLIVFLGLGILGTEFASARRAAEALKRTLMWFWAAWQRRRARRAAARAA